LAETGHDQMFWLKQAMIR